MDNLSLIYKDTKWAISENIVPLIDHKKTGLYDHLHPRRNETQHRLALKRFDVTDRKVRSTMTKYRLKIETKLNVLTECLKFNENLDMNFNSIKQTCHNCDSALNDEKGAIAWYVSDCYHLTCLSLSFSLSLSGGHHHWPAAWNHIFSDCGGVHH